MTKTTRKSEQDFDAIVIGSGIGGLTTAALLAKIGAKKVLVLEKHWILGGQTHEFHRQNYSWDVGVHYIGDVVGNALPAKVLQFITDDKLSWKKMPESYDRFRYPGLSFDVPTGRDAYRDALCERFPEEAAAIETYFVDVRRASKSLGREMFLGHMPGAVRKIGHALNHSASDGALKTTKEYLDKHVQSAELKAVLTSQWGDYGLPPSKSTFGMHATIVEHYIDGAYFPVGGASTIAAAAVPFIERHGGQVLSRQNVEEILIDEKGRAIGVRTTHPSKTAETSQEFFAPVVISTAGLVNTATHLTQHPAFDDVRRDICDLPKGSSAVTVYLGLKTDPRDFGMQGENYWIYDGFDHEAAYEDGRSAFAGRAKNAFVSFPSLKNPLSKGHTAEIISVLDASFFAEWEKTKWKKRGDDYEAAKDRIASGLIDLAEQHLPGLKASIDFVEVSTPLTLRDFTGWPGGGFYGLPLTPERLKLGFAGSKTPIKGLFIGGTDAGSLGVFGALAGGMFAAAAVMGSRSFPKILDAANAMPPVRIWTDDEKT